MPKGGNGGNGGNGIISGNKRDNLLTGTETDDIIEGNGGNDMLEGLGGNDSLDGGDGNDSVIGGLGDDTIIGGVGDDVAVFSADRNAYTITQIDATTVQITGPDGTDTVTGVESFQFADMTLAFADLALPVYDIAISNVTVDPALSDFDLGGDPEDPTDDGATVNVFFDLANNGLYPAGSATVSVYLSADGTLSGDDLLAGQATIDLSTGGPTYGITLDISDATLAGDYTLIATVSIPEADDDTSNNTAGTGLTLVGGRITGTSGGDVLGTQYNDIIDAGAGNDTIDAAFGTDAIDGGTGFDYVTYASASEGLIVRELNGGVSVARASDPTGPRDTLVNVEALDSTAFADNIVTTGSSVTSVYGDDGDDTIVTTDGDDNVLGGAGNDRITARAGSDYIDGGTDIDTATFSGNRDDYIVTQINGTTVQIAGADGTDYVTNVEIFEFADMTQSFAEVVLPRDPNLSANTLLTDSSTVVQGDVLHVGWDISSNGVVDAEASYTEVVIASAPDMASVIEVFGVQQTTPLATGTTGSYQGFLDTTGFAPGTYYVAAIADAGSTLDESDETDNVTAWTEVVIEVPRSDYRLDSVTVLPSSDLNLNPEYDPYGPYSPAGLLDLELAITNDGTAGPTDFGFDVWLSTDAVLSEDDFMLPTYDPYYGSPMSVFVDYGSTEMVSLSIELDEMFPQGDYYVFAVVYENDPYGGGYSPYIDPDNPDDNILAADSPISLVGGWTYGTAGNDLFTGTEYREKFEGYDGDDTLTGEIIDDIFFGGAGTDTVDFSSYGGSNGWGVVVSGLPSEYGDPGLQFESADYAPYAGGSGSYAEPGYGDSVERVIGSDFDDLFFIDAGSARYLDGGLGNDQIVGSISNDTILGGSGDDFIFGNEGDDILATGDGMDQVYAVSSTASGAQMPNGNDIVTDFDPLMDILFVVYDPAVETFDPFANLTQTAEGALVTISPSDSILLEGIDVLDLNEFNLAGYADDPYVGMY